MKKNKFLVENRNKEDLMAARNLFQEAVAKDDHFTNAYSGLAVTYLLASYRGYEDPVRMLWLAKQQIDTALTLDPLSGKHKLHLVTGITRNLTGMLQRSLTAGP